MRDLGERLRAGLAALPRRARRARTRADGRVRPTADAPGLVRRALLEQRLVLNATGPDTVRLLPPLIVTAEEIDDALARIGRLLGAVDA